MSTEQSEQQPEQQPEVVVVIEQTPTPSTPDLAPNRTIPREQYIDAIEVFLDALGVPFRDACNMIVAPDRALIEVCVRDQDGRTIHLSEPNLEDNTVLIETQHIEIRPV